MAIIADVLNARPGLQRRLFFLARRFVAGESVGDAMRAVRELNAQGLSASLDFLGEDVLREEEAARTAAVYLQTLDAIERDGLDANVSVKLSALGQVISEDLATAHLDRILERARRMNAFVRLDMEGSSTVDSTYRILERARAGHSQVGPVVQAYLHRAQADVERLVAQRIRVRLCKGAYKEPPSVAIQRMPEIRRNYMALARRLLEDGMYPGIATHDESLIEGVRAFAQSHRIGPERFEFQMLYGIRPDRQRSIRASGYRMRVYVPFGTHWAGYFARRLSERKENVFFVLRSLFSR